MALETPHWLTETFLQACLQNQEDDKSVEINSFHVTSALTPGYSYTSDLWRVKVDYQDGEEKHSRQTSLIMKEPSRNCPYGKIFDVVLPTEPLFYNEVMPLASKLLPNDHFAPKVFFSSVKNVLVMMDLEIEGYSVADRRKLLDFDHCRLYAIAAATLHASSVAVLKEHPELVEALSHQYLYSHDPEASIIKDLMVKDSIRCVAAKSERMDLFKRYSGLIRDSASSVWDRAIELYKRHGKLNVLLQGDPWTANMMFKYDFGGNVTDIRLLDFQMMSYASPLNDLVFFIWTSASHEVREERLDDFYQIYCDTLNRKLEECNCSERLSYDELKKGIRDLNPFALMVVASFYPLLIEEKPFDIESFQPETRDESKNLMADYYNEHFCETHLPRIMNQLDNIGVFKSLEEMRQLCC